MSVFAEKKMCAFQRSSGLVVIRWGSSGSRMVPYGSVYQSYINTEQSSDPSGLVGALIWHDRTRHGSTSRSTGPYWCAIDVRTPWARHGVSAGRPRPRRAPTAARRPAGGSVRLIFIGGPRSGRPATPIGGGRGYDIAYSCGSPVADDMAV